MSLTAALKKGLSVANTGSALSDDWDPYPDQPDQGKPVSRTNAAVVRSTSAQKAQPKPAESAPGTKGSLRKSGALKAIDGAKTEPAAQALKPAATPVQRPAAPLRRAANQPGPALKSERVQDDKRANWLGTAGVAVGHVNPAQYARELDRFAADEERRAVTDTLMDVRSTEIEGVAKLAARIKARYLAKLLDVGNPAKSGVQETEIKELVRYRETYEELGRGLDMLKAAIEGGDVTVSGMIRR